MRSSLYVARVSSSRAATTASVKGAASSKTALVTYWSGSFLPSPQLVRVTFALSLKLVHNHWLNHTGHTLGNAFAGPWVTSVGGTTGYNPEGAASLSGGGFSVFFPQPPYQDVAVPTFLQNLGSQYYDFYKCVRCRDFPDPFSLFF